MKTYVYANSEVIAQHDGDTSADRYFYLHDRLGSVRLVIDDVGGVQNYYTYEPFGQTIESGGTLDNAFMFTAQYFDSEIEEYYLRARQYNPRIARFTSRDPIDSDFQEPLTLHKYLYCLNDPVDCLDPTGEVLDTVIATSEGADMYARDLAVGGLALSLTYAIVAQSDFYQMAVTSIAIGVGEGVDCLVDFGLGVYAASRAKQAKNVIAGHMDTINKHFGYIENYSGPTEGGPLQHWVTELKGYLKTVRKAAERLVGKQRSKGLDQVDDMMNRLEELARKRGLPWNS